MPVERCQRDNEQGWRWGKEGYCYLPSEEGSDEAAKEAAKRQGRAIESNRESFNLYLPCQTCGHAVFVPLGVESVICPFCRARQQEADRAQEYGS